MATGVETRAQMDTEGFKALLLMNGGGSVALLAFLPHILGKPAMKALAVAVVWALLAYQIGLVFAAVHNWFRRRCSLAYDQARGCSPNHPEPCHRGWLAWISEGQPCSCCVSIAFFWLSLLSFIAAALTVAIGTLSVV